MSFEKRHSLLYDIYDHLETSPRGYDPTAPPGRHSRALASGNWRSSEADDDGGGWVTPRGSERGERWRSKTLLFDISHLLVSCYSVLADFSHQMEENYSFFTYV